MLTLMPQLAAEFSAPVGLLDPRDGSWLAFEGAPMETFPRLGLGLVVAASLYGKATLWHGEEAGAAVWMLVPVPSRVGPFVAALGFAARPAESPSATSVRWGPVCPEPALRAWGQSVADKLGANAGHKPATPSATDSTLAPPRATPDGAERMLVARLLRR